MSTESPKSEHKSSAKYPSKRISIPNYSKLTNGESSQVVNGDVSPTNGDISPLNGDISDNYENEFIDSEIEPEIAEAHHVRSVSPAKHRNGYGQESPKIIGNAWSFFNRGKVDKNELRYNSEEEEQQDKSYGSFEGPSGIPEPEPKSTEKDAKLTEKENKEAQKEQKEAEKEHKDGETEPKQTILQSQTFSSFIPTMFSTRLNQNELSSPSNLTYANGESKPRKKFQFFRKRTKDKKLSTNAFDYDLSDEENEDAPAGDRANKLVDSLALACPSVNLLASCLCEDEYGIARAPLLLSLLGFRVNDISLTPFTKNRKFRIDLEYGVGPQRLKWSVEKTAKDLLYLHSRFKLDSLKADFVRSEDFPRYPIPPLRNKGDLRLRKLKTKNFLDKIEGEGNENTDTGSLLERRYSNNEDNRSILSNGTFGGHFAQLRAHFSRTTSISSADQSPEQVRNRIQKNQEYISQVNKYLDDLMRIVALRAQSNRLFHFFEISPISSLLSYETGYQGKQGVIHIGGTAKSQGWRVGHFKANDLKGMIDRRSEKWFLVRNTYVMYVSDINSTLPLEVFLVDHKFKITVKGDPNETKSIVSSSESDYDDASLAQKVQHKETELPHAHKNVFKHLKITLENSERKLKLVPKSEKEHKLWMKSLTDMKYASEWSESHRFNSFAPIRHNCYAQWFVDARDYFWAVSSAIEMAKDVVFLHDWWLSPELYLRRPANGNQQWRIDRLLQRKAQQGVKIFVIIYRNVGSTVSTDSLYTKHSILSLNDENIHVIRSPNQLLQNTYFWAHHEKLCIIDHTIAFLGGIDLCYGRYDTPDHVLTDDSKVDFNSLRQDSLSQEEYIRFQTFPGKDYSNPRVKDFFALEKPYESMYNRDTTPRMPWHDVHMLTSGKVARDLARHFVQRWNYLLRQKRPSRFTPLLTPPPDLTDEEVKEMGLGGSCEVQLLRSSGNWSLGLKETEQSIQNAYLKLIETSEHFVYIENQFFVTSCFIDGNEIRNRIGDALVDRIIKAHNEGKNWRAVIVIPLMPGFESQVDEPDGSSVRVIMQCQYKSISRGATSIFAKLKKYGIEPDDYIQFFSLRKWGIIGPDRTVVTEQLYIHAKTMIVDDRAAIIGSANINERSMRGNRDSEIAAIVRDKETIDTTMDGKPYLAGKFAHTLRMRLMREHVGVSVDTLDIVERRFKRFEKFAATPKGLEAATNRFKKHENMVISAMVELASRDILNAPEGTQRWNNFQQVKNSDADAKGAPLDDIDEEERKNNQPAPLSLPLSFNNRTGPYEANKGIRDKKKHSYDARVQHSDTHKQDVGGEGLDKYHSKLARRARLNSGRFLKDLAFKSMQQNPTNVFLPETPDVQEFLESDDLEMLDEMDEKSEEIITERNKERWQLLKKISYLQRVAAREKDQKDDENVKRTSAGLPPRAEVSSESNGPVLNGNANGNSNADPTEIERGQRIASSVEMKGNNPSPPDETGDATYRRSSDQYGGDLHNENIPIVTLDERAAREVIQEVNSKGVEQFNKFIDPYGFEDPLDIEFYEDIWFDNARRNTEIFRLIFHTQPDDTVLTWKDYKQFSKLQRAFNMSQHHESRKRRERFSYGNTSIVEESESEDEESAAFEPDHGRRGSQATINVNSIHNNVGLLGHAPPSSQQSRENLDSKGTSGKRIKKRFTNNETIVENANEDHDEFADASETPIFGEINDQVVEEEEEEEEFDTDNNTYSEPVETPTRADSEIQRRRRRRRQGTFSARRRAYLGERIFERDSAERILKEIHGHLVVFPADWLLRELEGGNWFYNTDRIPPIDIYD